MIPSSSDKQRAPRNRTLTLSDSDRQSLKNKLVELKTHGTFAQIENKTIHQDTFIALDYLPNEFVDLAFIDPPYNLNKSFNETSFKKMDSDDYEKWLESWIVKVKKILKPNASIYICGDWKSSGAINNVFKKYFIIQNRITWER